MLKYYYFIEKMGVWLFDPLLYTSSKTIPMRDIFSRESLIPVFHKSIYYSFYECPHKLFIDKLGKIKFHPKWKNIQHRCVILSVRDFGWDHVVLTKRERLLFTLIKK